MQLHRREHFQFHGFRPARAGQGQYETEGLALQLDRSRPYGEVFGPSAHRYEQDGRLFDNAGNEIVTKRDEERGESHAPTPHAKKARYER